jgi:hypothetical protein
MIVNDPQNYTFVRFEVARDSRRYKYYLIIRNKRTHQLKRVPFGGKYPDGTPYEHYRDRALGYYHSYDHLDRARRASYRARHAGEEKSKFSSGWASWYYLW